MQHINEIDELIKLISKLPGLGPKSAKRIVLKLINNREELIKPMAKTLAEVYKNIFIPNLFTKQITRTFKTIIGVSNHRCNCK